MSSEIFGNLLVVIMSLVGVMFLLLFISSLVWLYRDAEARGKTGCLWLLIAFISWPFGFIAYLILRDKMVQL